MPTKTRNAALKRLTASPLAGNVAKLGQDDFKGTLDAWLKQHEAEKPFHRIRERADRIKRGDMKLRAAEQRGVSPDNESYKAGVALLAELRAEQAADTREYQIPFFAMNAVHNFLRASRGWGLPTGSSIEIRIPGVFDICVDLSETEIPF